ncbi:conserved hypothetical protein [Rubrivivax sp. A210]|uniref:Ig-like domain-containing protein n=1 Tax=Rubrivivax sp. A210 TaxID=2772301 RepID=UPI00191802D0|nr:Ig-like domain-containing protein [Rubrivivax sp. A210]CAD5374629.1 conserved hypothetical protein [Rubrivivax sp. A210]
MFATIGLRGRVVLGAVVISVLAGCGGGGGGSPPAPPAATLALADDTATATWNAPATVDVIGNDRASSGGLSLLSVSAPAHGTASVSNGRIVYTPASGYYGSDSFSYTARADDGGATSAARVSVSVEAQLVLAGTASDAPLPGAAVTADVAGRSFTATAGANGAFAVTVRSAASSDFVRIDAVGAGGVARLRTLVGEFGALVTASGGGRIDAATLSRLDATHHSTAMSALAIPANGGTLPTTAAQLDAALARVSLDDARDMAALIQRVVDGGVALPAGKADVWSLVSDATTYSSFLATTVAADPAAFDAALQSARASLPLTAPPAATELAGRTLAYYGTGIGPDAAYLVSFFANGNAQVRGDFGTLVCTWSRDDRGITLTFPQPLLVSGFSEDLDPVTGLQNELQVSQTALVLRRHALAAATYDVTVVATQTYLDGSRAGTTVTLATANTPGQTMRELDLANRLPVSATEFATGSRWGGFAKTFLASAPNNLPRTELAQDVIAFGGGGAGSSLTDPTASYTVSVAADTVSLAQTIAGQTFIANDYVRLAVDADGSERWLAMAPITAGGGFIGNGVVASIPVHAGGALTFSIAGFARHWEVFRNASQLVEHALFDDGTGLNIGTAAGTEPTSNPTTWSLVPGPVDTVEIRSGAPARQRIRTWTPLARQGSSLWVLEVVTIATAIGPPVTIIARVLRLVDRGAATK